jgi:deazaflavin-dependent oxidoreductase (nitroreductase family)
MSDTRSLVPEVNPFQEKSAFRRWMEKSGLLPPVRWFMVNVASRIDPLLMRVSGGRINLTNPDALVVLHHVGAKTGKARQTPLLYFTDGPNVIVVASAAGAPHHPAWLHNIRANPDVELWVGQQGGPHRARIATSEERAALWTKANAFYAGYDGYQTLAGDREIPVVICSPRS